MQPKQPHLPYSIVIEKTHDRHTFGYFSPDLPGFAGSSETEAGCLTQALEDIQDFLGFLAETGSPIPSENPRAEVTLYSGDLL